MAAEQENNIKFVQEIENFPCLYDYTLPDYVKRNITEKAWREIGKKFRLSGSECKEKWKNLRSVFVRHLKPPKSGSATAPKKPYYLTDYMQFAIPFIKIPGNTRNFTNPSKATCTSDEPSDPLLESKPLFPLEPFEQTYLTTTEILPSTSSQSILQQPTNSEVIFQQTDIKSEPQPRENIKRKVKEIEETQDDEDNINYYKMKQSKIMNDGVENSNKMFLLSFLSDMNKMNDNQRRLFKRRMLALVDEIIEESNFT